MLKNIKMKGVIKNMYKCSRCKRLIGYQNLIKIVKKNTTEITCLCKECEKKLNSK